MTHRSVLVSVVLASLALAVGVVAWQYTHP